MFTGKSSAAYTKPLLSTHASEVTHARMSDHDRVVLMTSHGLELVTSVGCCSIIAALTFVHLRDSHYENLSEDKCAI